jgi:cellulose biosynthesis protein BcsQ
MSGTPLAPGFALFAADPTWTDKEVLYAVGTTVVTCVGLFGAFGGLIYRALTGSLRSRARTLEAEVARVRKLTADLGPLDVVAEKLAQYEAVKEERDKSVGRVGSLEVQLKSVEEERDGYVKVNHGLTAERDALKGDVERVTKERDDALSELNAEQNRIKKATRKDGAIWTERVLANAIEFKPLEPEGRRTPILSMLNLKGGVGKTTATANLAAALSHRGYRVLLVDLDLQGSLTGTFLSEDEQKSATEAGTLVGDFLDSSFDAEFPNLMDYTRTIPTFPTRSMIAPTTDAQAYSEMNLTVRWFLRASKRDPRFLLRKELQLVRVTGKFDIILLDCPPLLNVSCINALAASDYVLVPVMPSTQATSRVPVLLQRLKRVRETLNPELHVMGFFGNRTRGSALTADEKNKLTLLEDKARDPQNWGSAVPLFGSFIPQSALVRDCEDERRTLCPDDDLFKSFAALAKEVESRLPLFCLPAGKPAGVLA